MVTVMMGLSRVAGIVAVLVMALRSGRNRLRVGAR